MDACLQVVPAVDEQQTANENCQVCNLPSARQAKICRPCKKFFLRNRDKVDSLRCLMKAGCCNVVDRVVTTRSGVRRRVACPRCRVLKCISLGLPTATISNSDKNVATGSVNNNNMDPLLNIHHGRNDDSRLQVQSEELLANGPPAFDPLLLFLALMQQRMASLQNNVHP